MDDHASPAPPHTAPTPRRWRRVAWLFGGAMLLLVLLLALAGSGLWWTLRQEAGTAWLFAQVPGLKITGGHGTLWGDYEADRIEFALPRGGRVVMLHAGWHGLRWRHAPWTPYRTQVAMDELHAQRVDVVLPAAGPAAARAGPPTRLQLPVALDIGMLHLGELHAAPLGAQPLRRIEARVHLGAQRGEEHRIDGLSLDWGTLSAQGAARIATSAPFALDARLAAAQAASAPMGIAWRAQAAASGPLAQPRVQATLRAQPTTDHPEQTLDLSATLRPFEAWPLGELQASTRALDVSAFVHGAPTTSLTGEARARTSGLSQPAVVDARFTNAAAGRWNEGRVPVRSLAITLGARPDDPRHIELRQGVFELGTPQQTAGRLEAQGDWTPARWTLDARLQDVQPQALDARAPAMKLGGPVKAVGHGFDGPLDKAVLEATAELAGQLPAGPKTTREARVELEARGTLQRIEIKHARLQSGAARASVQGVAAHADRDAPWQLAGHAELTDFDPAVWWPGREGSPLRRGANRLNARADVDLAVPLGAAPASPWDRLATWRGHADATLANSMLAGVPLTGRLSLRSAEGGSTLASAQLDSGANRVQIDGRVARQPSGDRWDVRIAAPSLDRFAPVWRLAPLPDGEAALSGALQASAQVEGRWPHVVTRGQLDASRVRVGQTRVQGAQAHWQVDTTANAALDVQATLTQLEFSQAFFKGTPPISSAELSVAGTTAAHTLTLRADTRALPPAWTDALQPRAAAPAAHTLAVMRVQGGALPASGACRAAVGAWCGWQGRVQQIEVRSSDPRAAPWLVVRDVALQARSAGGPLRVEVQPGRAEVLGATLRWSGIAWQAASGPQPALLDAQVELEPLAIAPLLARAQPDFGWGGDLRVAGHLRVHSAPRFTADVVLERQRGDLTVTDEAGITQALGLTDLRLGLDVHDGIWSFTQGLAGNTLGVAAGALVARSTPQATWPTPDTPIQGVVEVRVANLGTWGPWLPAGWRLDGALRTSASIGGRFGAPEYTGEMRGSGLGVRNFLQGVAVTEGEIAVVLQGPTARIERFTARAGKGSVKLEGQATLGEAPQALLSLQADQFQLLGRVDRRIVTSGQAQLRLDRKTVALDGDFHIDEGLIDFSRSDAPHLSDDVHVVRGKPANGAAAPSTANPAPGHEVKLDLKVALGDRLRLRGRGIDTGLRGDLRITSPNNRLAIAGTLRAEDGTYAAYGQKLTIDRGLITFNGPMENPRLDIEATRPNTDVRVGVLVTGTALTPRVRLFSEPEMSEMDKLSWLVLGRAGDALGGADTALLQRAALALLAGENGGGSAQFTKAIGLDEVSLRQTEGEVRETVVTLGKQISQRWYVGYERSLAATAGSWQLIYRVARRFTLRAQTGEDSSLDVIWTWRWQ